jgi:hypothetical protein
MARPARRPADSLRTRRQAARVRGGVDHVGGGRRAGGRAGRRGRGQRPGAAPRRERGAAGGRGRAGAARPLSRKPQARRRACAARVGYDRVRVAPCRSERGRLADALLPTRLPNAAGRALSSLPVCPNSLHTDAHAVCIKWYESSGHTPLARLQAFPCVSQALGTDMTHGNPARSQGPRARPGRCPRRRRRRRGRRARPRTPRRPRGKRASASGAPRRPPCSAAAGRPMSWCCPAAGWRPSRASQAAAAPPRLLPPRCGPSLARQAHPAGALPPAAAMQHSQKLGPPLRFWSAPPAPLRLRSARMASFCALCAWTAWAAPARARAHPAGDARRAPPDAN